MAGKTPSSRVFCPTSHAFSELHVLRGHQPSKTGFIMGHEFTGTVTEIGDEVQSVTVGDSIVSPFTVSWYYISKSSRCIEDNLTKQW